MYKGGARRFFAGLALAIFVAAAPTFADPSLDDLDPSLKKFFADAIAATCTLDPPERQNEALRQLFLREPDTVIKLLKGTYDAELNAAGAGTLVEGLKSFRKSEIKGIGGFFANVKSWLALRLPATAPGYANLYRGEIQKLPAPKLSAMRVQVSDAVGDFKISTRPEFIKLLDPKSGIEIPDKRAAELIQAMLGGYFDRLPADLKGRLFAAILNLPPGAAVDEKLAALVLNAPPLVQKIFQLAGRHAKSEAVTRVMERVLSSVTPIPYDQVRQVVKDAHQKEIEELFSEFSEKPLAVGTVGQAHAARLKQSNEEVVVKVLKPGVQNDMEREAKIWTDVAPPKFKSSAKKIGDASLEELNLIEEANKTALAEAGDTDENLGLAVARVMHKEVGPKRNMLVLARAPGVQVSKVDDPERLEKLVQGLSNRLDRWMDRAMFGDGFLHGDLHGGNMFFDVGTKYKNGFLLTQIDHGQAVKLTRDQQLAFRKLALAALSRDPNMPLPALRRITSVPFATAELLEKEFLKIMHNLELPPEQRLALMFKAIIDANVDLPEAILSFDRGRRLLESELAFAAQKLRQAKGIHVPTATPDQIYKRVVQRKVDEGLASKNLLSNIFRLRLGPFDDEDLGAMLKIVAMPKYTLGAERCGPEVRTLLNRKKF